MKIIIPVAYGLEAVVKRQLKKLGYDRAPAENGRISLEGGWEDIARLNMFLRSGERVLIGLSSFHAATFDELYEGVRAVPWEEYAPRDARIMMEGKCVKSTLGAVKACGSVAKKAIADRLCEGYSLSTLPETGPRMIVGISIYEDTVSVTADTSGEGLHKRGYRDLAYTAPLKETLAAAIVDMTYYFPDKPLADIFCGSGTIPIEAAMREMNIAPGKKRSFDYTAWPCAPEGIRERALEEALDGERRGISLDITGSDINAKAVSAARRHAARAGVGKNIKFYEADMAFFTSSVPRGVLISNPPYGERLGSPSEAARLYKTLGRVYSALPDWNMYILTGYPGFGKCAGRRADRTKKLYNANIECTLYSYLSSKPLKGE